MRWRPSNLQSPHQHQDEQDQDHKPQATTGAVTPTAAVWPGGNGSEEHQDQQDQEYGSEWHGIRLS